jgi:hypothetical protein
MRPGPATPAASFVVSCAAFVTAWRRMTASARQQPRSFEPGMPRFAEASCRFAILRPRTRNHCDRQRPCSCSVPLTAKSKWGRRPQRPGNQSRLRAFLECPPPIHPRESPAAAGSAAIIRQAQECSRFAEPTLKQIVAPRNTKNPRPCAEAVDDETSLWKPEEI